MAKTKRKQLAALAALNVTSPESPRKSIVEHQNGHCPAFNEELYDKSSASFEVRQQRIIIWIPSSDPTPRLVNSRSFRVSGTPSRKRKRSIDNGEEKNSSDGEDGHVYKKYAKVTTVQTLAALYSCENTINLFLTSSCTLYFLMFFETTSFCATPLSFQASSYLSRLVSITTLAP